LNAYLIQVLSQLLTPFCVVFRMNIHNWYKTCSKLSRYESHSYVQRIKLPACNWMWVWSKYCNLLVPLVWWLIRMCMTGVRYVQSSRDRNHIWTKKSTWRSVCACSVLLCCLPGIVEDQRMFWFSALGGSEVVNWERNLRTQNSCVCGACLQIGLDGVRMVDPSTSRTLRIYPLETIERWEVGNRVVLWFCLSFTFTREFFFVLNKN
jgi:hypothetical protein